MQEDPTAKRNRGDSVSGLILLGFLAVVLVGLMGVYMFRPGRPATPPDPVTAEATLSERVASEQAEDAERQQVARMDGQSATPRPQP